MYQYYHSWSYCTPPDWLQSGILPLTAGSLLAGPNYEVRPRILPNYYLVCITGGTGRMQMGGKEFRIGDGELFTLFPHVVHSYQTDPNNLLKMFWIGFSGSSVKAILKNAEISPDNPIVKYENRADLSNALQKLSKVSCEDSLSGYLNACSRLLEVFGSFCREKPFREICVKGPHYLPWPPSRTTISTPIMPRAFPWLTFPGSSE